MTDVLIVGGGLAGSSLALMLGRLGLEVELVERSRFPREKVCGEGLMPAGAAAIGRLGLAVEGAPFRGIRYHLGDRTAAGTFPSENGLPARGLGVRRRVLDAALFEAAAACPGVRAFAGVRAGEPLVENGRVEGVEVEGEVRRAKLIVAADGLNSPLRRRLGLDVPARRKRTGLRAHFRLANGAVVPEWVDVYLGGGHELYVTPLPRGEILVAMLAESCEIGASARAAFDRAVRGEPRLARMLEGVEQVGEFGGAFPLSARARARVLPGLVLFGDAAGYIDPVTGGGMTQALLSAELLAARLGRRFPPALPDLTAFDRERASLLRDYHRLTRALLWVLRHRRLTAGLLDVLNRCPSLFTHLLGVSAGVRLLVPRRGATHWERGPALS